MFSFHYCALAILASQAVAVITGQTSCNTYMCITGLHDSDTNLDTYTLAPPRGSSLPRADVGYMAIGFGTQMGGSPMIIGWPNSDGSIILSQRQSSGRTMPQVVASPPRSASLLTSQSFSNTTSTSISFTVPSNSDSTTNATNLIWAYGTTNPGSSASASIRQHAGAGTLTMALLTPIQVAAVTTPSGTVSGTAVVATPTGVVVVSEDTSSSSSSSSRSNVIITHAILGALAAMLFVPLGVLTPRLARGWTTSRWWFPVHGVLGVLAATLAIATFGYATAKFGTAAYGSTHRGLGLAFFVLIIVQVILGSAMGFLKTRRNKTTSSSGRGPTNYIHIVLGLGIMGVGFAAVYTGMTTMWTAFAGRGAIGRGWIVGWAVVVGVSSAAWLAGLALLPKQRRNEAASRLAYDESTMADPGRVVDNEKPETQRFR